MARKKVSVKEMKQTDEFVSTIGKISDFIGDYSKEFTIGAIVVVVLLVGTVIMNSVASVYNKNSGEALSAAMKLVEEEDAAALEEVKKVADKYSFSNAGAMASFYEAELLFKSDKRAESIEKFKEISDDEGDSLVGNTARLKLAGLASQEGNYSEAESYLSAIVEGSELNIGKDYALFLLAGSQEMGGKNAEAEATYSKLVEDYPEGQYRQQAENKIIELAEKQISSVVSETTDPK